MKIRNLTFAVCTSLIIASCTDKKSNEQTETLSESTSDCNCSELNLMQTNAFGEHFENWKNVKKGGELYTGDCIEKDENDTIIRKLEFKNGWVVRELRKENVFDDIYTIIKDMRYKQLQKDKGFSMGLSLFMAGDKFRHILSYEEYKNGNLYDKWSVGASGKSISVSRYAIKGDIINWWSEQDSISGTNTRSKLKCLKDAELFKGLENEMEWTENNIQDGEFYQKLNCLKDELKPFNYWKVK